MIPLHWFVYPWSDWLADASLHDKEDDKRHHRKELRSYGGQAVIEGVMMKGRRHVAVALRRTGGEIDIVEKRLSSSFPPWMTSAPFARGFFLLWDMLSLGMWALHHSQDRYLEDRGEKPADDKGSKWLFIITATMAIALALIVFKVLPTFAVDLTDKYLLPVVGTGWRNVLEGLLKFGIFVGYVSAIGLMADVQRVFMYHGAEHTVIGAYEDDPDRRDMEFIEKHSRLHPRCGTSFIAILIVISVIIYYFLDRWLIELGVPATGEWPVWWIRWPLRILAIPILAGVSYEALKGAHAARRFILIRPFVYFGMLFQVLTTRRPSRDQLEVAWASLEAVRRREENQAGPQQPHTD